MTVYGPEGASSPTPAVITPIPVEAETENPIAPVTSTTAPARAKKCYRSPKWITGLGYALFSVLVVANGYVLVTLAMGNDS